MINKKITFTTTPVQCAIHRRAQSSFVSHLNYFLAPLNVNRKAEICHLPHPPSSTWDESVFPLQSQSEHFFIFREKKNRNTNKSKPSIFICPSPVRFVCIRFTQCRCPSYLLLFLLSLQHIGGGGYLAHLFAPIFHSCQPCFNFNTFRIESANRKKKKQQWLNGFIEAKKRPSD